MISGEILYSYLFMTHQYRAKISSKLSKNFEEILQIQIQNSTNTNVCLVYHYMCNYVCDMLKYSATHNCVAHCKKNGENV